MAHISLDYIEIERRERVTYRKLLILVLSVFTASASLAQSSPENVVAKYGTAVAAEDWKKAVSFFSKADTKKIKDGFAPLLESRSFRLSFFPGKSVEEIDKLDDAEFVANIFGYFFRSMRSRGISIEMNPPKVLGSVEEGSKKRHVVYRQDGLVNQSKVSIVDITTVQKIDETWCVDVPEEFDHFAASVKERLTKNAD